MAKPTPTPSQTAAINAEVQNSTVQQTALAETATLQDPIIAQKQEVDDAFKALFDYYNAAIIGPYDTERRAINGTFVPSPIVEADIVGVGSNPPSGRLVPTPPASDIVRIGEFDAGGYSGTDANNELQHITDQAGIEDVLENGYGAGTSTTATTVTSITPTSTTLDVTNTVAETIQVGDVYFVEDGGSESAVIQIDGITDTTVVGPPFTSTLDITVISPPTTSVSSGATFDTFGGFTNGERTSKTASNSSLQGLMNSLIADLETELNNRKARIAEMNPAISGNEDPDGTAQFTTATTNNNTADAFIDNYLLTTDISDTGLASLATERGTRTSELNSRLAEILANYTGQTEDYYESRYQTANNRGNTVRGTLRALNNAASVKSDMLGLSAGLQGAIDALNGILP